VADLVLDIAPDGKPPRVADGTPTT
jgi:hypothetical protein